MVSVDKTTLFFWKPLWLVRQSALVRQQCRCIRDAAVFAVLAKKHDGWMFSRNQDSVLKLGTGMGCKMKFC